MSPLVKLTGEAFHREVRTTVDIHSLGDVISGRFAKYTICAALQQFGSETEEVVDAEQTQVLDVEAEIGIEFTAQAFRFGAEFGQLLYKYSCFRISVFSFRFSEGSLPRR